jgi:glycosyltransferase involved in cell wall biosynthesis
VKLLFVGSRYLPYRHEGDKNFWLDVVRWISKDIEEIHIISLNSDIIGDYFEEPNIWVYNIPPTPFRLKFRDDKFNATHADMSFTNNYPSKSLSFLKILRKIRQIVEENRIDLVHFMDNYGPIMLSMKVALPKVRTSISAPTYHTRSLGYDTFLRWAFAPFDIIIPFSDAFGKRLINLGLEEKKLRRIRWGVDSSAMSPGTHDTRGVKESLGIHPDHKIVLWSGYLQQTNENDFLEALKVAKAISEKENCTFVFAFKPVHFRPEHSKFGTERLKIVTDLPDFLGLLNASDILLSPVTSKNSILAPPLLWIESMAMGVPIVASKVPGAEELIEDNVNGMIAGSFSNLVAKTKLLLSDDDMLDKMSKNAREKVIGMYNIDDAVSEYLKTWKTMCGAEFG